MDDDGDECITERIEMDVKVERSMPTAATEPSGRLACSRLRVIEAAVHLPIHRVRRLCVPFPKKNYVRALPHPPKKT